MTSTEDTVRQRDASRTKRALLEAAEELFGRHGYERTTLREIGEQAGVDAALIARYFGNKASIYIACLEADDPGRDADHGANQLEQGLVERVIDRATRFGPTPVLQAIVVPTDDPHVGQAARTVVARRTVGPLRDRIAAVGLDRAELRRSGGAASSKRIRGGRKVQIRAHRTDGSAPAGRLGAVFNPLEETPCGFEPHPGHHITPARYQNQICGFISCKDVVHAKVRRNFRQAEIGRCRFGWDRSIRVEPSTASVRARAR